MVLIALLLAFATRGCVGNTANEDVMPVSLTFESTFEATDEGIGEVIAAMSGEKSRDVEVLADSLSESGWELLGEADDATKYAVTAVAYDIACEDAVLDGDEDAVRNLVEVLSADDDARLRFAWLVNGGYRGLLASQDVGDTPLARLYANYPVKAVELTLIDMLSNRGATADAIPSGVVVKKLDNANMVSLTVPSVAEDVPALTRNVYLDEGVDVAKIARELGVSDTAKLSEALEACKTLTYSTHCAKSLESGWVVISGWRDYKYEKAYEKMVEAYAASQSELQLDQWLDSESESTDGLSNYEESFVTEDSSAV